MSERYKNNSVSAWMDVGRTWSKIGRGIGKVALENVADALKKTAQALETPADQASNTLERRESSDKSPTNKRD